MKNKISQFISDVYVFFRIYKLSRYIIMNYSFIKGFKAAKRYRRNGKELKHHLRPIDFSVDGKLKKFK